MEKDFKFDIVALRRDRAEGHLTRSTAKNLHSGIVDDSGLDGRGGLFLRSGGKEERKKEKAKNFGKATLARCPAAALCERLGWYRSAFIYRRYSRLGRL